MKCNTQYNMQYNASRNMMIGTMSDLIARPFRVLAVLGLFVASATPAHGQTLFALPDTTPNYVAYRSIEECLMAGYRVTEEQLGRGKTIWLDTVGLARSKVLEAEADSQAKAGRPDSAVQAARACLSRFNADTATFKSSPVALEIVKALFMAHRWEDAERFASRALDSVRLRSATEYKAMLQLVLELYVRVRPVRFAEATRFYKQLLTTVTGDSLYRTIDAELAYADVVEATGDTALRDELWWRAIRINDTMSVEERTRSSPDWRTRLSMLATAYSGFTREEGFDSLAISAVAYNLYIANTVRHRIYGEPLATAKDERVQPYQVPAIRGAYAYTSTRGASAGPSNSGSSSSGLYVRQDSLGKGMFPMKGRINFITWKGSFCSVEEAARPPEEFLKSPRTCVIGYSRLRNLKEKYPDLEITVLSNTYGTVGQLGPLQPADEADTLAKLFLGHHRVPANLVVEKTEFFHVEAPDGRRIDFSTPMMEEIGDRWGDFLLKGGWFTDKEGNLVAFRGSPGEPSFDRMYEILKNRTSK